MKLHYNVVKGGLLLAAIMLMSNFAMAQRVVKGKVTDVESSDALIGASVSVVGTTRGTVTDIDGNFSVDVPNGATQLRVSYTGYAEQTITLTAANVVNVALAGGSVLDEVVVIGYGSVKKSDVTGAVSTVGEKNFNKGVISPEQLIQGRAAGVQVSLNSGEPGGGINIRVRGTSSVRSGNGPLFVVDGVPLSADASSPGSDVQGLGTQAARNPLNFINPNDIASIDILKDASATAIYGSRGANGVVIITTKNGASGKGSVEYGYTFSAAKIAKKYKLGNREQFVAGWTKLNPAALDAKAIDFNNDTDWQDQITQTGIGNSHSLAFGGGDKSGAIRFSLGYLNQEGIIKESGIERLTGRMNANRKFLDDRLNISTNVTIARTHDDGAPITQNAGYEGDVWLSALKANPTWLARDTAAARKGKPWQVGKGSEPSPLAMIEYSKDFTNTLRALGNINAELKLTGDLTFKTVLGFDNSQSSRRNAFSKDLYAGDAIYGSGRLYSTDAETTNKLWENYFTYNKGFGRTNFTGLVGYSYQKTGNSDFIVAASNFVTADLNTMINNASSAGKSQIVNSNKTSTELQSYFTRINFNIDEKYLLTASLRADGSSRFGSDNKYSYFPSFAAKWRIMQESFAPKFFSDLSLRAGYGIVGNQEIPYGLFIERSRYSDGGIENNGNLKNGTSQTVSYEQRGIKWETTKQLNFGIDFGFFNSRVSGSLDFYKKNTSDLLVKQFAAQPSPSLFQWANLDADIENKGVELSLNLALVDGDKFDWRFITNGAYNANKVKKFASIFNTGDIDGQGLSGAYAQRVAEGQPLYAFFVRDFQGYDANGISKYQTNGVEGVEKQFFVGKSPIPKVNLGITNQFNFGDADLSIFFNGNFGHYIYNNTANALFTAGALGAGRNVTTDVFTSNESRNNAPETSTRFLEKGDFLRLQDVTFGYTLPIKSKNISGLRLFVNGQNLWISTKYTGQDPEVNTNKNIGDVPSLGIDYSAYPRSRNFSVGANVTF